MSGGSDFWVRATGDTEYVVSHQNQQYRKKLLAEVKKQTNLMITTSVDQNGPLTDESEGVNQFCFQLESIIVHGLQGDKKKSNYARDFISFWDYIQHASRNATKELKKLLKTIEKLPDVHTHDGKGRAWIRAILNQNLVITAFEMLINEKHKEKWYAKYALLVCHEEWSMLLSLLSALAVINFDMTLNEPNLDIRIQHEQPGTQGRYPQAMLTKQVSSTGRKKRRKRKPTTIAVIDEAKTSEVNSVASLLKSPDDTDYKAMLASIVQDTSTANEGINKDREEELAEQKREAQRKKQQIEEERKRNQEDEQRRVEALEREERRKREEREKKEEEMKKQKEEAEARRREQEQKEKEWQEKKRQKEEEQEKKRKQLEAEQKEREKQARVEEIARAEEERKKLEIREQQRKAEEQKEKQIQKEMEEQRKQAEKEQKRKEELELLTRKREQTQVEQKNSKTEKALLEEVNDNEDGNDQVVVIEPTEAETTTERDQHDSSQKVQLNADNENLRETQEFLESKTTKTESDVEVSDIEYFDSDISASDLSDDNDFLDEDMDRLFAQANLLFSSSASPKNNEQEDENKENACTVQETEIAVEDEELTNAMKSLSATSFVDQIDVDSMMEESQFTSRLKNIATGNESKGETEGDITRVRGDHINYFLFTVAEDKTPLAAPALPEQTVHVIAPLYNQSKEPPPFEKPVSKGTIIETETRGFVMDLSPRGLSLPVQGNSWKVIKNQIPLQIPTKKVVQEQGSRCPSCKVEFNLGILFSSVRYCNLYGLFFCLECHDNEAVVVPSYVLQKWDFTAHKVSNAGRELLEKFYTEPLYNISKINSFLYESIAAMKNVRLLRQKLFYIKDYLLTCNREKVNIIRTIDPSRWHLLFDKHLYAMRDLTEIYKGDLGRILQELTERCILHVKNCPLCGNKGYICKFCCSRDYIFPFQLKTVLQCKGCDNFFHRQCYNRDDCPPCNQRLLNHTKAYS